MIGDLIFFKHDGLYDKGIEWLTRSPYTHVGTDIGGGMLIESYPGIGVRKRIWMLNEPDMYRFRVQYSDPEVYRAHLSWLEFQIGKPYDWFGIAGVAFDHPTFHFQNEWFCSELAVTYQEMCGYILVKRDERLVTPGDLASSPLIYQLEHDEE